MQTEVRAEREDDMASDLNQLPRVLIVDDSRMVRATLIKHIRSHYDYREEGDGEAAWQVVVLDHAIQAIICDLSMPVLDGFGLLARIRNSRLARIRELPVIMISGDEDEASRERAKALGVSDFIMKEIEVPEELWVPGKPLPDGTPGPSTYCAVIVKTVDAQTRSKTGINELLRD